MTFDEFYTEYRKHDGDSPRRVALAFGGYKHVFSNGDTYVYLETLKPGATVDHNGLYDSKDFDAVCTWNGEEIEKPSYFYAAI